MRIYQDYVSDKMIWDNDVNYSSIAGYSWPRKIFGWYKISKK